MVAEKRVWSGSHTHLVFTPLIVTIEHVIVAKFMAACACYLVSKLVSLWTRALSIKHSLAWPDPVFPRATFKKMASNNECCCLCSMCFDGVSSVKKRKLLHGPSASTELSVLMSINQPLATSLEFQEGYLCVICQRKLLKVKKLREELQTILEEINSKLSNATCKLFYILMESVILVFYFYSYRVMW